MMFTPLLNAPIRDLVIEKRVNVFATLTTTELHVSALFAPIDAVMLVCASLKSNLPLKLVVCMILLGMLKNKSVAFVIWEDVDRIAPCVSRYATSCFHV